MLQVSVSLPFLLIIFWEEDREQVLAVWSGALVQDAPDLTIIDVGGP